MLAARGGLGASSGQQVPDLAGDRTEPLPDYDNLRIAFEHAAAARDGELALRLVTSLSELAHLRVGYECADWAERALELVPERHPLFPAAVGAAARGAWNRGEFDRAARIARRTDRRPLRGTGRVAYPGDVLADVALYSDDPATALAHYLGEADRARRDADPIRLVWTLYYLAVCHAVRRAPELGVGAAQESVAVAEATGNPTARSMSRYALGLVRKKSDPDEALVLLDDAAGLAASVRNFWWTGIALMEAAATRAVHRDPVEAARAFVEVLDHWDRVGDWTQQWLNLRYIVRLLVRLRADSDAVALHQMLAAAGKSSPLDRPGFGLVPIRSSGSAGLPSAVDAVAMARASLARYG